MKTAKVTLADATYYLAFDGEAMFTLRDDFGGTQLALEAIEQDTRESFAATCAIAAVLAERGELLRRRLGYDPGAIPEKDDFLLMVRPFEIVTLKRAIMTAIELGYGREVTSPAEALFMAPGEVFDLWELYLSAHGKNRGEEGV